MMRMKLAFNQTSDERFLVLAEIAETVPMVPLSPDRLLFTTFEHEDVFLKRLIDADLPPEDTTEVVTTVLLAIAKPVFPQRWVDVNLSPDQSSVLGLKETTPSPTPQPSAESAFEFTADATQFYDFLMQSPVPFVVLSGPEHRFTLINPPYVKLISQLTQNEALGKTVREVLPELNHQPFFDLLDRVYTTGEPFIGNQIRAYMRNPNGPGMEDRYFDFIYHPIPDGAGAVSGIMIQATDVTERVLSHATTEHREQQLFRQWEELEKFGIESRQNRSFARQVNHTIETMKSYLSQLQSDMQGPNAIETLRHMQEELQQLSATILQQPPA
jgi:PAS domain-containing protein